MVMEASPLIINGDRLGTILHRHTRGGGGAAALLKLWLYLGKKQVIFGQQTSSFHFFNKMNSV